MLLACTLLVAAPQNITATSVFTLDIPTSGSRDLITTPDLDGDGLDDITVVHAGRLQAYSSVTRALIRDLPGPNYQGSNTHWIGDANGDGVHDLIANTSLNPYVVAVQDGMTGADIYVVNPLHTYDVGGGHSPYGRLGDVDGDGEDDFYVRTEPPGGDPEHCEIRSCVGGGLINSITRSDSFRFFERAVEYPDRNGDGISEIAFGDTGWVQSNPTLRGRLLLLSPTDGSEFLEIPGPSFDFIGERFEVIGDVDNDGVTDLISRFDRGFSGRDTAWVYSGLGGAFLYEVESPLPGSSMITRTVDDIGDIDGDGHDDFVAGDVDQGAAFVFSGATGEELWRFVGSLNSGAGRSVRGVGDIDGNGTPDWVVLTWTGPGPAGTLRIEGFSAPRLGDYLEFEVAGNGSTPIVDGQALEPGMTLAPHVRVLTEGPGQFGAAAFSTDPNGPNAGTMFPQLLVDSGNAIILQGDPAQTAGIFDTPAPAANGGAMTFELLESATLVSIDLVGIGAAHSATLTLRDAQGRSRVYDVPPGFTSDGPPSPEAARRTLRLDTLEAQAGFASTATVHQDAGFDTTRLASLRIEFTGPSAVDNLWLKDPGPPFPGSYKILPSAQVAPRIRTAAGLKDVNGDGVRDYVVASQTIVGSQSTLSVHSGLTGALLHSTPAIRADNLTNIPDLNGNGFDDIVVGSGSAGSGNTGIVYVHDGATGQRLSRIEGPAPGVRFGSSLTVLDDLDGDGVVDYAIGTEAGTLGDRIHIHSGSSGALIRSLGLVAGEMLLPTVVTVDDVDADSFRDMAVSYRQTPSSGSPSVRLRIYSPMTGTVIADRFDAGGTDGLGETPLLFNDVNGDGLRDVFVGPKVPSTSGGTVLSGADLSTLMPLPANGAGTQQATVADVDGDGLMDVLSAQDHAIFGRGVRAISGATFEVLFDTTGDATLDLEFILRPVGDLDRDGLDDIAATSMGPDPTYAGPGLTLFGFQPELQTICTGEPHSAGLGARLRPRGSTSVQANDLVLEAWNLPPTSFVLLMNASAAAPIFGPGSVPLISDGKLCLAPTSLARHQVLYTVSGGMAELALSLDALPTAGAPGFSAPAMAGESRIFQCWFRDTGGVLGSNLSDAIQVTFKN